jgi:hypothetical protein
LNGNGPVIESSMALPARAAARFASLALACIHREYPNKIAHVLVGDRDVRPPRVLTPVFYGCFDWHSAVHNHWLLTRLARRWPEAPFAARARAALDRSFAADRVADEMAYLKAPGRESFERPYGLAWLLQLCAELRQGRGPSWSHWTRALRPLEAAAVDRLSSWLPRLSHPVRSGEHSQSAFALGLMLDFARVAGARSFATLVRRTIVRFYAKDRDGPLALEPSGEDFLSPCLAEADVVRRVLDRAAFARWLSTFLPRIPREPTAAWLAPAHTSSRVDPKLVHLDGLHLSRAWMLEGIAAGLSQSDGRQKALRAAAAVHRRKGLAAVNGRHYAGGHWLPSFAVYLVTGRGLPEEAPRPSSARFRRSRPQAP